jgi:hypothetical protein
LLFLFLEQKSPREIYCFSCRSKAKYTAFVGKLTFLIIGHIFVSYISFTIHYKKNKIIKFLS